MRTDLTSEIDSALSGRNAGSRGFWEVARSGNGNMTTDLMEEDGHDYDELEGLGEKVEEMTPQESAAEDAGNRAAFKPFREPRPGEKPPHAPKPGKAWIIRRIRMESRRPGGQRLCRCRWAQVSPAKWQQLKREGKVAEMIPGMDGLGFLDISSSSIKWAAIGAVVALGGLFLLKRKSKPTLVTPVN